MKIVVIGNAKTGLDFVGPFSDQASADAWVATWRSAPNRNLIPVGPVDLIDPSDKTAGATFPNRSE